MNIFKTISDLVSKPVVIPAIKIAEEAFKLSPGSAPSSGELAKIRKIAADYHNAVQILINHTDDEVRQKINDLYKQHQDAVRSGDLAKIKLDGADAIRNEFEMKRSLARHQMAQLEAEAAAHAKPIYVRTISAVEALAGQRETYEREQCESFGLEFSPSPILRAMQDLATRLKNSVRLNFLSGQPKSLYFFLNLED